MNARSAVGHAFEMYDLIETPKLEVLFITETWLTAAHNYILPDLVPEEYHIIREDRNGRRVVGVAVI